MKVILFAAASAAYLATPTLAETPPVTYEVEDSFDAVTFAVESAILDAGLVIDHTSHTGEMLERTRGDVGSAKVLFTAADIFSFCSATVSRQVMEADLSNIQNCPFTIFVYETPAAPGKIIVGHRAYEGSMAPVGKSDVRNPDRGTWFEMIHTLDHVVSQLFDWKNRISLA